MVQGKLELAAAGCLHPGERSWHDHVVAEVYVVEHRGVAFEVAGLVDGLELKGAFKVRHLFASPTE
ncbi:hypothetical protein D3C73_1661370 [compost metagenome]